jgi:cytidylate kinase
MYRALALKALREGVPLEDEAGLGALAAAARIELVDGGRRVLMDGEDVTADIRRPDVSAASSRISQHPVVRREMVARQRALGAGGGVVLDGRDIGTAVFADAPVKFYVDADPARRAERRRRELGAGGAAPPLEAVEREIRERDRRDTTRADSPLTRAADAVAIDTTTLDPDQVVARMLEVVRERGGP